MNNLLLPKPAENMGGGWETRRSRPPGDDWIIVKLGHLDYESSGGGHQTLQGQFPGYRCHGWFVLAGCAPPCIGRIRRLEDSSAIRDNGRWQPSEGLQMQDHGYVRLIYPDGGVSRLRVFGVPSDETPADERLKALNTLDEADATAALMLLWKHPMGEAYGGRSAVSGSTELHGLARWFWWQMDDADWKEAFTHHPKSV